MDANGAIGAPGSLREFVTTVENWGDLARQRLSKPIGRDGSPSRPTPAAKPHLCPPSRWLAPKFKI
jgi:hypothetical protein